MRRLDPLTSEERSTQMGRIKSKDTAPELTVRRLLWRMGYRYRLHCKDVPGSPDIVFKGQRKVIFVHGCFWHRHPGCPRTRTPKSRVDFWTMKFVENIRRDRAARRRLTSEGWQFLVVWECESEKLTKLQSKIERFLGGAVRWTI